MLARRVVRVGDRVYRPTGWWTPPVHRLLHHLQDAGFSCAPRVLGLDGQGREILTHIPGRSGRHGWAAIVDDRGLASFARLLRAYHEAVRSFRPPADAAWACTDAPLGAGELVCHGDFGPWNLVWRGRRPVGILDWDLAGPGPPMDDVAYALAYGVPFRDDQTALRWLGYDRPPDRRHRIEVFAQAYGLPSTAGLVDQVAHRQRLDLVRVRTLAQRGLQPQASWVAAGFLDEPAARAAWTEQHRGVFE